MTKSSLQNAPKHPPKEVSTPENRIKSGFSGIEKERFSFIKISVLMWRHHPDLNRGIKLLQSSALPLGYGALLKKTQNLNIMRLL